MGERERGKGGCRRWREGWVGGEGNVGGERAREREREWCASTFILVVDLGFTTLLTSQVISVVFYFEHEMSDKFCSEALISA